MKKTVLLFLFISTLTLQVRSQIHEIGGRFGLTSFLSDLGGGIGKARPWLLDMDVEGTRPTFGILYRYHINRFVGIRANFGYAMLVGSDSYIRPRGVFADEWFRWVRNLDVLTHTIEFNAMLEVHLKRYAVGVLKKQRSKQWWAPYLFGGGGGLFFNPTAKDLNGVRVNLQPLGTEGQGNPGHGEKYLRITPVIVAGGGFKFNVHRRVVLGVEMAYTHTFTDYLDDVSGLYPEAGLFVPGLTDRTQIRKEDNSTIAPNSRVVVSSLVPADYFVSAGVDQRGDASDNDHFVSFQIAATYTFGKKIRNGIPCYKFNGIRKRNR